MKSLIFDIDGTLTDLWPLERTVLEAMSGSQGTIVGLRERYNGNLWRIYQTVTGSSLPKREFRERYRTVFLKLKASGALPKLDAFRSVAFIRANQASFRYVYATGGTAVEAEYALESLGLLGLFDLQNSIARDTYRFSKATGLPFQKLRRTLPGRLLLVTDSESDMRGAQKAQVPVLLLQPDDPLLIDEVTNYIETV